MYDLSLSHYSKTTNIEVARSMRDDLVNKYSNQYSSMIECLDEGFEDGFQYCAIEETNYSRLKSTNMLERLNSEIRRREKSCTNLSECKLCLKINWSGTY